MKAAKLEELNANGVSTKRVNQRLAEVRSLKPTEVVIWYSIAGKECGVISTAVTDRTKTVGALTAAAMDVWNS